MRLTDAKIAVQFHISFLLRTSLLLRSGEEGEFTDSSIEKTPDDKIHIAGYIWASLIRRSMSRLSDRKKLSGEIGNFNTDLELGISPFWFSPSLEPLRALDVRPQNRISREYGCATESALFEDEIVPPGLSLNCRFTVFRNVQGETEIVKQAIAETLWVINEGIENIGGGWSYGHGRLEVTAASVRELNLNSHSDCLKLFDPASISGYVEFVPAQPRSGAIIKTWSKITATIAILDGQLLGTHSERPPQEFAVDLDAHDKFLFRQTMINKHGEAEERICVTGKALRQAILRVPLERKWRSTPNSSEEYCGAKNAVCECTKCVRFRAGQPRQRKDSPDCTCKCRTFGSPARRGMVTVFDAGVIDPVTEILQRIALCEHSMQIIHMFNGEYLKGGKLAVEILVDSMGRELSELDTLVEELTSLLREMDHNGPAPSGWYRLGATSSCTGQLVVSDMKGVRYV